MSAPDFIPGLTLNRRFYWEVVRPLLDEHLPLLAHSAGLIGYGSDVLGYDTPMSTDHNWGPRLHIYLAQNDYDQVAVQIDHLLRHHLPPVFAGYSVHFSAPNLADNGTQVSAQYAGGPVNHLLSVTTVERLFQKYLGVMPDVALSVQEWLALPEQKLLEVTAGEVFHDGLGTLNPARAGFAYYPDEVWKVRLAAAWQRISEEEAFVGRTGDSGDELGSWIIAARLVRDVMRLSFLYARRYAPYSKWLGTAFRHLPIAQDLLPHIHALMQATDWHAREAHLGALYTRVAAEHNASNLTLALPTNTRNFHGRPFQVLAADRFADAICATLQDRTSLYYAKVGAVDQFTDCVAIHSDAHLAQALKSVYHALTPRHFDG